MPPASSARLRAEGGEPNSLSIVSGARQARARAQARAKEAPPPVAYKATEAEKTEPRRNLSNRILHPAQTFDSFVPGAANEFAHRAARSFAEGETSEIGLLYIHGGFGYGKTHLLNAIALEAAQARASARCSSARKISCASSWARCTARKRSPSRKNCAAPIFC